MDYSSNISLVMCVRDEAECVERAIRSVRDHVDEAIFLDTGSVDETPDICARYGHVLRLKTDFLAFDFGEAKTIVSWMARGAYVLLLDADETLTGAERLRSIAYMMDDKGWEALAIPRRRWLDWEMRFQVEKEAYPDLQVRLYRNERRRWVGALHETLQGVEPLTLTDGLVIEHFVDPAHLANPLRAAERNAQRRMLAQVAGVPVEGSDEAARLADIRSKGTWR